MVLRYYFDSPNNEFVKYRICENIKIAIFGGFYK